MANLTPEEILRGIIDGSIEDLDIPNITSLGERKLYSSGSLETLSLENCTDFEYYSVQSCPNLTTLYVPNATKLGGSCFANNPKIANDIHIKAMATVRAGWGPGAFFEGDSSIKKIVVEGHIEVGGDYAFRGCTSLEILDMGDSSARFVARYNGLTNDSNLRTIIIRKANAVKQLIHTQCFSGTPFWSGGVGGTIYIPKVLYDELGTGSSLDYQSATNWATIYGYGTITWAQIEGSEYEHYYVDGTPIE